MPISRFKVLSMIILFFFVFQLATPSSMIVSMATTPSSEVIEELTHSKVSSSPPVISSEAHNDDKVIGEIVVPEARYNIASIAEQEVPTVSALSIMSWSVFDIVTTIASVTISIICYTRQDKLKKDNVKQNDYVSPLEKLLKDNAPMSVEESKRKVANISTTVLSLLNLLLLIATQDFRGSATVFSIYSLVFAACLIVQVGFQMFFVQSNPLTSNK